MTSLTFDAQKAFEHIRYLSETIGPRFGGSSNDQRGTDYIRSSFEKLGLNTWEQSFTIASGELVDYALEITEPAAGPIPCYPLMFSSENGPVEISGELVFIEGFEEPWIGPHLEGKIVVWTWPEMDALLANFPRLARVKPQAILVATPRLGEQPAHLQLTSDANKLNIKIPIFFITWQECLRLFQMKARRAHLTVHMEGKSLSTCNVIAELKGTHFPDEIIVIGAHHDTVNEVPGSMDNASGVGMVLELARLYAGRGSRRTLRFVAWAGEEFSLLGSRHYLSELKKKDKVEREKEGFIKDVDKTELDRHLFVISLDVLGLALSKDIAYVLGPENINAVLGFMTKELGIPYQVKSGYYGTDSIPFVQAGVPAVSFSCSNVAAENFMHTPLDIMANLDVDHVQRSGDFIDTFIQRSTAQAQAWPFERSVPESQQSEIKAVAGAMKWLWNLEDEE